MLAGTTTAANREISGIPDAVTTRQPSLSPLNMSTLSLVS
jgi:hypothetical protein